MTEHIGPILSTEELQQLIKTGQNKQLAWLKDVSDSEKLSETLTAMANAQGGKLIIGIADHPTRQPQLKGVTNPTIAINTITQTALSLTPPLIIPFPSIIMLEDKHLILIEIPNGMPYIYTSDGRYLIREEQGNKPLNINALHQLMIERGGISFETEPAFRTTLDDLDWNKVSEYARLLRTSEKDVKQLLYKRGCLVKNEDEYIPTNAGILLFGKDPMPHMRGAEITAVRFAGESMSDTFSRQDITGTLPDQIKRAETFLIDHLRKGVEIKATMARSEQFEYPLEAAREVVVNAVAHRDYSIAGNGIRLFLFKDRMEVNSPGKLPGPVTLANIKDERFSRNPAIVQVLADMGFIERLGYGIDRMIDLMEQNDLQAPEFNETGGGFRVTLYNKPLKNALSAQLIDHNLSKESFRTPLNPRQEAALSHLNQSGNTRITNSELQKMFPDVHAETIRRDLADLVTKDLLHKLGQKRGSYYILKKYAELHLD